VTLEPSEQATNLRRPIVSDLDGTREGGLVFCIALILGVIAAASVVAGALTSFWVWFAILITAGGIAVNVKLLVAHWSGHKSDWEDAE